MKMHVGFKFWELKKLIVLSVAIASCLTWNGCNFANPWSGYSPQDKRKVLESNEIFTKIAFSMSILEITQMNFKGKLDPSWLVGKVISNDFGQIGDSIIQFKSEYFIFSNFPIIRLKADHELCQIFQVGDTLIKQIGSNELINPRKRERPLSIFPPLRLEEKKKRNAKQ